MTTEVQDKIHYCKNCKEFVDAKNTDQVIKHQDHKLAIIEPFEVLSNKTIIAYCFKCDKQTSNKLSELAEHELHINCVGKDNRTPEEIKENVLNNIKKEKKNLVESINPDEQPKLIEFAEGIMKKYKLKTLTDTKEILVYQDGVYLDNGDILISEECEKIIPDCSKYKVSEVTGIIQRRTFTNRDVFNQDLTKLVLKNGVLDLQTMEFKEGFDPEFLTTIKIPIVYNPLAKCPKFIKLLIDTLEDKEKIIQLVELMSNILTVSHKNFEASLIMVGDGSNGKSTILKIIRGIIGVDNTASISIHSMQNERFSMSQLDGKLANIYADISNRELTNLGRFKMAVSGEHIMVEKKGKDGFLMSSFAKHFFSANEMPDIKDNSDGAFRRIYVLKFENQFLPAINRIEDLDQVILKEEASGIFNLMLQNYTTLLKNKGFRYKQSIAQVRETIKRESDKLKEFTDICIIKQNDGFITKDELYHNYTEWCKFKAYEPYSKQKFGSNLPSYSILDGSKKIEGKTARVWLNIGWNWGEEWVKSHIKKPEVKTEQDSQKKLQYSE